MRRIISKQAEAKRSKRNQYILGGILIFVMFFSVLGYGFMGQDKETNSKKIEYNGFEFINQNGLWYSEIGGIQFAFKYNPKEVGQMPRELNGLENYQDKPLYISSENSEAELEIYRNLDRFVLRRQPACLVNETCEDPELPIKTCDDNFILIKESENMNIVQENNCVHIFAPSENLTQITDEFLFKMLGIE